MALPQIITPKVSEHGGELILLGIIGTGIVALLIAVIATKAAGWDVAACLLVLQAIIGAVKDRWSARAQEHANERLAQSNPPTDDATGKKGDPTHIVDDTKKAGVQA